MTRLVALAVVAAALLVAPVGPAATQNAPATSAGASSSASADAPPARAGKSSTRPRRQAKRVPSGYGFLPGYEPPPRDRLGPVYGENAVIGYARGGRYWSRGRWLYGWGGPGYYRGQWNGGSFGPCYTQTPIGAMWNCGR